MFDAMALRPAFSFEHWAQLPGERSYRCLFEDSVDGLIFQAQVGGICVSTVSTSIEVANNILLGPTYYLLYHLSKLSPEC